MKEGACWHLSRGSISQAAHSEYKQVISFDVICKCRLAVAITPTLIFVPRIFVIARAYQSDVAWGHNAISRSRYTTARAEIVTTRTTMAARRDPPSDDRPHGAPNAADVAAD